MMIPRSPSSPNTRSKRSSSRGRSASRGADRDSGICAVNDWERAKLHQIRTLELSVSPVPNHSRTQSPVGRAASAQKQTRPSTAKSPSKSPIKKQNRPSTAKSASKKSPSKSPPTGKKKTAGRPKSPKGFIGKTAKELELQQSRYEDRIRKREQDDQERLRTKGKSGH